MIISPSDVPGGQHQPLTTGVSCIDTGIVATPFVVPPSPDIEQPCRQLQDSLTCWTQESRPPWLLCNLSLPRRLPVLSSSSSSSDRFRPLRRESSRLTGDALLPPPADDCLCPVVVTPYTVGRCEQLPGQNTLLLCPNVRWSGWYCQPDPPVHPTGSVIRTSTTLPEGSFTSGSVIASSDHSVRMTLLLEGLGDTIPILRVTHRKAE